MSVNSLLPKSKIYDENGGTRIPKQVREAMEIDKDDSIRYGQNEQGQIVIEKVD